MPSQLLTWVCGGVLVPWFWGACMVGLLVFLSCPKPCPWSLVFLAHLRGDGRDLFWGWGGFWGLGFGLGHYKGRYAAPGVFLFVI